MDILKYSALKVTNDACACIYGGANTAANTIGYNAGYSAILSANDATQWTANSATYTCSQQCAQWCNWSGNMPWCYCSWVTLIPRLPGSANTSDPGINPNTGSPYSGFQVCGTNLKASACCLWTVPSGATFARFQIWGAGGGSGSGCCCGGSIWGTNGAYASVIIPVVPGCQYTLCAGCAYQTNVLWGSPTSYRGCMSYVTGYGLCNFCAEGACWKNHYCHLYYDLDSHSASGCCFWAAPWCNAAGGCLCNTTTDYCVSGCSSCGIINYSRSASTNFYGCYVGSSVYSSILNMNFSYGQQVVGIPGLNGCMCFDSNHYGSTAVPPVYGFESTTACAVSFSSASCGGALWDNVYCGYRNAPGAGGSFTHVMGGCTVMCNSPAGVCGGDVGRSGMVCVTYF